MSYQIYVRAEVHEYKNLIDIKISDTTFKTVKSIPVIEFEQIKHLLPKGTKTWYIVHKKNKNDAK